MQAKQLSTPLPALGAQIQRDPISPDRYSDMLEIPSVHWAQEIKENMRYLITTLTPPAMKERTFNEIFSAGSDLIHGCQIVEEKDAIST